MTKHILTAAMAVGLGLTMLAAPAGAQYYKGKTINFLIPVPGGSGLDLIARNFVQHFAKNIPGNP